jgi:hypothetical protein
MSTISLGVFKNILFEYQNLIIVIGLIISFSGGSWDITFHILSQPESFFSYPHTLVYTGIFIVISTFLINFRKNILEDNPYKKSNYLILLGAILILTAGPFDFSWHLKFGLDGLLSPPHITLLTGWMLVGIGNLQITNKLIGLIPLNNKRSRNGYLTDTEEINNQDRDENEYDNLNTIDHPNNLMVSKQPVLIKIQLILNVSFILLVLSGFIYFFSLPFSETQFYNYNPDPLVALLVYSFGFPFLLSSFFISILKNYPDFNELILIVGSIYIIIMLLTQIISNPFLFEYSWFYLLNIIPFVTIYLLSKKQVRKTFTKINITPLSRSENLKDKYSDNVNPKMYIIYALTLAILSFTICFPLNTYVLNEELYGYLIYQNLVAKVYTQLVGDYFIIFMSISMVGGLLGYGIVMSGGIIEHSRDLVVRLYRFFYRV